MFDTVPLFNLLQVIFQCHRVPILAWGALQMGSSICTGNVGGYTHGMPTHFEWVHAYIIYCPDFMVLMKMNDKGSYICIYIYVYAPLPGPILCSGPCNHIYSYNYSSPS